MSKKLESAIVIGAGVAGLAVARALANDGVNVTVYDKGRGVGGRCATRRWDESTFDHGAQYFTARDPAFQRVVEKAVEDGAVVEWCRGFVKETGTPRDDDEPRYRGEPAMTAFPKWLAQDLAVETNKQAARVACNGARVAVSFDEGGDAEADALVITAPVPQALALLEAGGIAVDDGARQALDAVKYLPCFALMGRLNATPMLPDPGGMYPRKGGPLAWIADNNRKGISENSCITAHASPEFSGKHFDTDPEEVKEMLIEAVEFALGCQIVDAQIHRWRYAKPMAIAEAPCVTLDTAAPILIAGDAFGGARVEGAYLSGLAAADSLLSR